MAYYSGLQTHSFVYQTNFGGRIVPTKRKIIPQKQDGRLLPKLSEVEKRFADEEAKAVMAYAESRQGRLEAQREILEALEELPSQPPQGAGALEELPSQPPQGAGVIVEEISTDPQAGQAGQALLPGIESQPSNAGLLAQPSSPRTSSTRPLDVGAAVASQEEPAAKRMRPEENILRRVAMVERRLVEVGIGDDIYYHLDNVIDNDFVAAWESEDAEIAGEEESNSVDKIEMLWSIH
eukprot:s2765_g9.t1